ncbi:MAG: hypothetical protein ACLRWQ_07805 [Flavonifractor plautii]
MTCGWAGAASSGRGWTIRQFPELEEALEHYRGIPITKRKVLGVTDGFHVLELVKKCAPASKG